MKQASILFLVTFSFSAVRSQHISPGGIKQPLFWLVTDENSIKSSYKNLSGTIAPSFDISNAPENLGLLNYRQAIKFSSNSTLYVNANGIDLSKASYFTVYQCTNANKENIIWHTLKDQKTGLVLTTSRLADLSDYKYMNYIDKLPQAPKVNMYVQQKEKDSIAALTQSLNLGSLPSSPSLPITTFTGLLPEFIVFDRVLNGQELLQVASYLSLKYGITLSEPEGTYLNSLGEIIWDGNSYSDFHHNITGIARDDSSGFVQRIATSSNNPGLLTVSTEQTFENNSSYIWGDNDLPLIPREHIPGVPPLLQKEWLMVSHGTMDSFRADIFFDTKQIDAPLPVNPVFWLAIDRSGTGDFSLSSTEYFKMSHIDANKIAQFRNVIWKRNNNKKERFAFIGAKDILVSTNITKPQCSNPFAGVLQFRVWGATFPCSLKVSNEHGQILLTQTLSDNREVLLANISSGRYTIAVSDAASHSYSDSYYVNNQDGPKPINIERTYILPEGQRLELNAAAYLSVEVTYEWRGGNGFYSKESQVSLSDAGNYTLTATKNGCAYVSEITIKRPAKNAISNISIYPNPSNTGSFGVKIKIDKVAPVTMTIFTEDGKLVGVRQLHGFANYTFTEHINQNGLYHLVFRSGLSVLIKDIIILK